MHSEEHVSLSLVKLETETNLTKFLVKKSGVFMRAMPRLGEVEREFLRLAGGVSFAAEEAGAVSGRVALAKSLRERTIYLTAP